MISNFRGIRAIYRFEMARFGRTVWTSLLLPVITTTLYFVVFGSAIGSRMSDETQFGDMISGITHLTPSEAKELYQMIRSFLDAHECASADSDAWEFAIIGYPVGQEHHE